MKAQIENERIELSSHKNHERIVKMLYENGQSGNS